MKRAFDIVFSLFGLLLLSPLIVVVSILVRVESLGDAFYRGERVGLNGKLFNILKFRSMIADAAKLGGTSTSQDDPRVTRIGSLIRKYKIDEIPQLINVLCGDMSFVGPRPQVEWAVKLYNDSERRLLSVRPGITDYASIAFRNEGEILKGSKDPDKDYLEKIAPEKIRLGLKYVDNHNLWIDLKIIAATIRAVILG